MRTAKFFTTIIIAIMIVTGCDWVRSQLGMATSEDIEALKNEQQRMEAQMRIADSIERATLDSAKAAADSAAVLEQQPKKLVTDKRFHVIMGSFKDYSNSARMVQALKEKGYSPVVFSFRNGFEAVSVSAFDKVTHAFNQMYKLLDQGYAPDDVWVYDIKQNLHN
ncbi:MAG: hypothetical protein VB097_01765 [Rikenellaceae bacterium]|jgi:hypothetical protein|nr:hypothetical protein [Rikenellaceae bacterium]